jgi:hypothetical protein
MSLEPRLVCGVGTVSAELTESHSAISSVMALLKETRLRQMSVDFILGSFALALEPISEKAC